jgi:hypothetical protein
MLCKHTTPGVYKQCVCAQTPHSAEECAQSFVLACAQQPAASVLEQCGCGGECVGACLCVCLCVCECVCAHSVCIRVCVGVWVWEHVWVADVCVHLSLGCEVRRDEPRRQHDNDCLFVVCVCVCALLLVCVSVNHAASTISEQMLWTHTIASGLIYISTTHNNICYTHTHTYIHTHTHTHTHTHRIRTYTHTYKPTNQPTNVHALPCVLR